MPPVADEQRRNLKIIMGLVIALVLVLVVTGVALYLGLELPPYEMRDYYASSDGYTPPPNAGVVPAGTVARGTLIPAAPGRPNNSLAGDPRAAMLGKHVYFVNCAMCHGEPGQGIGPVGKAYVPVPPDLAARVPARSDGYLYGVITDGVRSTPTPETARYLPQEWHAFGPLTTPKERWATIAYLRATFGARRAAP